MKILTVIGARPQFIKAAAVSATFCKKSVTEVILHTGQHFDQNMSAVFFNELGIPEPKYNLGINSINHGAMTGKMLEQIEKVLGLFRTILSMDGGTLELVGVENGTATIRYVPGQNEECPECVLTPENLQAMIEESMQDTRRMLLVKFKKLGEKISP